MLSVDEQLRCNKQLVAALFLVAVLSANVFAKDNYYYVATTGDDTDDGSQDFPWLTIQHAVYSLSAGDTLFVANGTYTEKVNVDKPVNIIGDGMDNTTLQAISTNTQCFDLNANDINISGFKITGSTQNGTAGIVIRANNTNISGQNITGNYFGILIDAGANNHVGDCAFSNNSGYGVYLNFSNNAEILWSNATMGGGGILASGSNDTTISNVAISNMGTEGIYFDGLFSSGINNLVSDTSISNCKYAIRMDKQANAALNNITTRNNLYYGVGISESSKISIASSDLAGDGIPLHIYLTTVTTVSNSTFSRSIGSATDTNEGPSSVLVDNSQVSFYNSTFNGSAVGGNFLHTSNVTAVNSTFRGNDLGAGVMDASNATFQGCTFTDNFNSIGSDCNTTRILNSTFRSKNSVFFDLPDERRIDVGQKTGFRVLFNYINQSPAQSISINSIESDPAETLSYGVDGNALDINITPSRKGLYSILVNLTDDLGNIASQRFYLGNQTSVVYYLRPDEDPTHGQPTGGDCAAFLLTPPNGSSGYTCSIWAQASPDELPPGLAGSSLITGVNLSTWYSMVGGVSMHNIGFAPGYTFSATSYYFLEIPVHPTIGGEAWHSSMLDSAFWAYNENDWYNLTFKLTSVVPRWYTHTAQPSIVNISYLVQGYPRINGLTDKNATIISATASTDNRDYRVVIDGGKAANLSLSVQNGSMNYTALYDGASCNTSGCTFTQNGTTLDFALALGSEHTLQISGGNGSAPAPLSNCGDLNITGAAYIMVANASGNGSTCFNVTAENVTLDCDGYAITGNNLVRSSGIYSDQFNTTIKNCDVRNFQHAIYFNRATNGTISNTTAGTTHSSFHATGTAIYFVSASNNTVSISSGNSTTGIGMAMDANSSQNTIIDSCFYSTGGYGVRITGNSNNNQISNSNASATYLGISIEESSNNGITGVSSASSTNHALQLSLNSNNTISNSTFNSTSSIPVYLSFSSGNMINNNTFISSYDSALISMEGVSGNNTLYWNNFTNTSGIYVNDTSNEMLYQNKTFYMNNNTNTHGTLYENGLFFGTDTYNPVSSVWRLNISDGNMTYINPSITNGIAEITYANTTGLVYMIGDSAVYSLNPGTMSVANIINVSNGPAGSITNDGLYIYTVNYSNTSVVRKYNITNYSLVATSASIASFSGHNIKYADGFLYVSGLAVGGRLAKLNATDLSIVANATYNITGASGFTDSFAMAGDLIYLGTEYNPNIFVVNKTDLAMVQNLSIGADIYGYYDLFYDGNYIYAGSNDLYPGGKIVLINTSSYSSTVYALNDYSPNEIASDGTHLLYTRWGATGVYTMEDLSHATRVLNKYNTTVSGKNQGNIYANVMNGSVDITGAINSSIPGLYIGAAGAGYPYSNSTSRGKLSGTVADYAPLTPRASAPSLQCGELGTAGATYTMAANASIDSATCFNVTAENVTLDCNGHSILGDSHGEYGIFSNQNMTTIRNCNISEFMEEIHLDSVNSGSIFNTSVFGNFHNSYGIFISNTHNSAFNQINCQYDSGTCMMLASSTNNTVSNFYGNTFGDSQSVLELDASASNTIQNATATSTSGRGIFLFASQFNSLLDSIGNSSGVGICLSNGNNNLVNNSIGTSTNFGGIWSYNDVNSTIAYSNGTANASFGIEINSMGNNVTNSIGSSNSFKGLAIQEDAFYSTLRNSIGQSNSGFGIHLGSDNNTIINSTGLSISGQGMNINSSANTIANSSAQSNATSVYLDISALRNLFIGNTFTSTEGNSALVRATSSASGNTFCLNNFTNTSRVYVNDTNGSNYYNCTYEGMNQGNIYANVMNGSVDITGAVNSSIPGLYIGAAGAGYPYSNSTSQGKLSGTVADYAPLTPRASAPSLQCGELGTAGATYNMYANASINGATCFNITAENVTLDCNGFSISGNNTPEAFGVVSGQNYTAIKNCRITGFDSGIVFISSSHGQIYNNTIDTSSHNALFFNSGSSAVLLYNNSDYNTVLGCNLSSNYSTGISVYISSHNAIINSTASSGGRGSAIEIRGIQDDVFSLNNTIIGCNGTGINASGIDVEDHSRNSSVINSIGISTIAHGIYINNDEEYNVVMNSTGISGQGYGIYVYDEATYTSLINSTGISDRGSGIGVSSTNSISIINCTGESAGGGSYAGIIIAAHSINITGGRATGESNGLVQSGDNLTVVGLNASGRIGASINSNGAIITGITAHGTDSYGISFIGTSNTISNSSISSDSSVSLYITSSSNNTFANNTMTSGDGAHDLVVFHADGQPSANNTLYWNNFTQTSGFYANDTNGGNFYNSTINGHGEGNIYANVMNGSVDITGAINSSIPGLYIGAAGAGYPYSNSTSQGKLSGTVADYAPLTARLDTAPSISAIEILPSPVYINAQLNCRITAFSNAAPVLSINYTWAKNGVPYSNGTNSSAANSTPFVAVLALDSFITQAGDNWSCSALASDGLLSSGTNSSGNAAVIKLNDVINLTLNGTAANFTATYSPSLFFTANASSLSGTHNLYLDGSSIPENFTANLAAGYYNFTAISSGNENYTSASAAYFANITLAASTASISANWSISPGQDAAINCSMDNQQSILSLYQDGAFVNSSSGSNFTTVIQSLAAGAYNFTCNSSESENYSASNFASGTLSVGVAGPNVAIQSPVANSVLYNNTVQLNFTAAATTFSLDAGSCEFSLNGTRLSLGPGCGNGTQLNLTEGVHMLTVYAKDVAGNEGSSTISFLVNTEGENSTILDTATNVSINETIYVTPTSPAANITMSLNATNVSLNMTAYNNTTFSATLPEINVNATTGLGNVVIGIPNGTAVSGSSDWNGTLQLPMVKETTVFSPTEVPSYTNNVNMVLEIGVGGTPLRLSRAVRILLPGMKDNLAGFQRGAIFTPISTACSEDSQGWADANLSSGADCKINNGSDLAIWTKHFTLFGAYNQTYNGGGSPSGGGSNGGGGGGGGGGGSASLRQASVYMVDLGLGKFCPVAITREIKSSANLSVLTTTLENTGNESCSMEDFMFSDTIPYVFANAGNLTFVPMYDSISGQSVEFGFPSFSIGESKTFTYSSESWIPPSRAKNFTEYVMSAKKQAAPPTAGPSPGLPAAPASNVSPALPQTRPQAKPAGSQPGAAAPKTVIYGKSDNALQFALGALALATAGALIVYFLEHMKAGGKPGAKPPAAPAPAAQQASPAVPPAPPQAGIGAGPAPVPPPIMQKKE